MSNDIISFGGGQLPSVQDLVAALSKVSAPPMDGDTVFMQYDGTGHWVYGSDKETPEDGSRWAINPYSFIHGYIAWSSTRGQPPLDQHMGPLADPKPDVGPPPEGTCDMGWEYQLGFSLRCHDGEDEGTNASYAAATRGCHDLVGKLGAAISEHVKKDPTTPVPVVELLSEQWYQHKKHGKTWVPEVKTVDWMSMTGEAAPAPAPAPAASDDELDDNLDNLGAAEDESPRRRRRRAA